MTSPSAGTLSVTGANPNGLIKVYRDNVYIGNIRAGSDGSLLIAGFLPGQYYITQTNEKQTVESGPSNAILVQ